MDPEMATGAVVFDCHPALLPVSLDVSGIDMPVVRSSGPLAKTDVTRPSYEQPCEGVDLLSLICPELGDAPLFDPGTDVEDELPSPVGSPMVICHGVALLPEQVEEDVDLAQVLAEFSSLREIVTPIHDLQVERVVAPAECHTPDTHEDLLVTPAGPAVMSDDVVQPPTGSASCSPVPLIAPKAPAMVNNLSFRDQPWADPSSGGEPADYRFSVAP